MTGLVEWLRAALDEHERIARAAMAWQTTIIGSGRIGVRSRLMEFAAANDPAHALRTVQAHREIVDLFEELNEPHLWEALVSIAKIYRESFPGFDPSWIERS